MTIVFVHVWYTRSSGPYGPFLLAPARRPPSSKWIPPLYLQSNFEWKNGVTICFILNHFKVSKLPPLWGAMQPQTLTPVLPLDLPSNFAQKNRVTLCFSLNCFQVSKWPPLWGAMGAHWGAKLQIDITNEFSIKFCVEKWCHTLF